VRVTTAADTLGAPQRTWKELTWAVPNPNRLALHEGTHVATAQPGSADLDHWARTIAEAMDRATSLRDNETELREDVDPLIRQAARELYNLSDRQITAERRAGGTRRKYDKAYGGIVFEWEWQMGNARRREGAQQALDYLASMREDMGLDRAFTAVVSDGREWGFLATDLPEAQLSLIEPEPQPDRRFQWRANSAAACRRFLVLLGSNRQMPVTSRGLANAFGPQSDIARKVVTLLVESLVGREPDDRADTLYREWRRSLEVVYGNLDDEHGELAQTIREAFALGARRGLGELLFVVHTYFALVVRLVAIEVLGISAEDESSQPTTWSSLDDPELIVNLRAIDAGTVPGGLEIQNLFEGDVFSWYLDVLEGNADLLGGIRDTLDALQGFALPRVAYGASRATDVLRDLYLVLVPRELRKSLGEFSTPTWLAQASLERLREVGADLDSGRVLDPTCGTGTFLLPVLRERIGRLRAQHGAGVPHEEVRKMLNDVVGFDINPVAVTATRANYAVALGDLATVGSLTLPVWRADSILVPDEAPPQTAGDRPRLVGHPWRALRTSLPDPFPIPPALATADRMADLRQVLEGSLQETDPDASRDHFLAEFDLIFGPNGVRPLASTAEWESSREVAAELQERIRELRDDERNGVWARIIENNFAPLFAGRFNVVVGNPPWLTWTKTPEEWRQAGEVLWKRYGLWRIPPEGGQRSQSLASSDIAIVVFALALDRYAIQGGTVGLLVPRAVVNADPGGRAFRQFRLKPAPEDVSVVPSPADLPFRVLSADDWSEIKPFSPDAANTPYFLTARPGEQQQFPVATRRWMRAEPGVRLDPEWVITKARLRAVPGASNPVDRGVPTAAWSFQAEGAPPLLEGGSNRWSFGKGLDTRGANGVFFVKVLQKDTLRQRVLIRNEKDAGRNPDVRAREGWVESAVVHPLLRGRDVRAWLAKPSGYIVAAYAPTDLGKLIKPRDLRRVYPEAHRWLARHSAVLKKRNPPPTRSWDLETDDWYRLDGPMNHMGFGNIVAVREQQNRPAAAVVATEFDDNLARTAIPLIDHKLVFCAVDSPDEAVYLATFINSTPIQDLLASFSNEIAVAPQTLARLPIPDFDLELHQPVVEAGRGAVEAVETGDPVEQEGIDEAVVHALDLTDYAPQPAVRPEPRPEPVEEPLPGLS
jgi:SAM-dependent methyltransferase